MTCYACFLFQISLRIWIIHWHTPLSHSYLAEKRLKFNGIFLIVWYKPLFVSILVSAGRYKPSTCWKSYSALTCDICTYCCFNKICVSCSVQHRPRGEIQWFRTEILQEEKLQSNGFGFLAAIFLVLPRSTEAAEVLLGALLTIGRGHLFIAREVYKRG